ncbi:inositol polyphosphate 1-phosphatase, partial [Bemisia tabaci]|uniref:inositol polyphosphate 1-phosphatase n=1 Tax=Bemisia tabaci TaxID=7038 RepID=UPI003B288E65
TGWKPTTSVGESGRIARACRQNPHLLSLLVQEKSEAEKNPRFVQDFKTLADVLVQEVVRHEVGEKFPDLKDFIYGEENNKFSNAAGDSIVVSVAEKETDTASLLSKVLAGDAEAANLLAAEIHSTIHSSDVSVDHWPNYELEVPLSRLGIWIDPIDSTAEYISGGWSESLPHSSGLACVTILIGIFDRESGTPIAGVINQPFHSLLSDKLWNGRAFWGLSYNGQNICSVPKPKSSTDSMIIAVSGSEKKEIKSKLAAAGFSLIEPAGAGYKLLCVITGDVSGYVLSKGSTYFWDTCGCHAVLKSLNGSVIKFSDAVAAGNAVELLYQEKSDAPGIEVYSNSAGIIAFREKSTFDKIIGALK